MPGRGDGGVPPAGFEEGRKGADFGSLGRPFTRRTTRLESQGGDFREATRQLDMRRRFTEAVLSGVSAGVIGLDGRGRSATFSSRRGFEREEGPPFEAAGDVLHDAAPFRVRGRFVDHDIPCLSFALEEKARVKVARDRIAALGITPGPWLRSLKRAVLCGAPDATALEVRWRDRDGEHDEPRHAARVSGPRWRGKGSRGPKPSHVHATGGR